MPFSGNGVFTRLYSFINDAAANIKIRADRMDNELNGFATGLSTCITKDGQTTVTAALPMAGFNHTGVGAATARTHYARTGEVQDGSINWVAAGGSADAITANYAITVTALVDGQLCFVRAGAANATTTPTFSLNGLTARTIVKNGGVALAAGDIAGAGHELILRYLLASTRWELLNPSGAAFPTKAGTNIFTGTNTFTGALAVNGTSSAQASISLAEDTDNGTHKVIIQPPASLASDYTLTLPADDGAADESLTTNGSGTLAWVNIITSLFAKADTVILSGDKIAFADVSDSDLPKTDTVDGLLDLVAAKIAAYSAGGVGTYMIAVKNTSAAVHDFGATISGADLDPCSLNANVSASVPAGTWRSMGYAADATTNTTAATLWLRTV